jgi:hypothetical protein
MKKSMYLGLFQNTFYSRINFYFYFVRRSNHFAKWGKSEKIKIKNFPPLWRSFKILVRIKKVSPYLTPQDASCTICICYCTLGWGLVSDNMSLWVDFKLIVCQLQSCAATLHSCSTCSMRTVKSLTFSRGCYDCENKTREYENI